jgi:hypothetical protein
VFGLRDRLGRPGLDAKGEEERRCGEGDSLSRFTDRRSVVWRGSELEGRGVDGVRRLRSRCSTAYVLSDQGGRGRWNGRAAAVLRDARCALIRVLARPSRDSLRMAPDRTQQRGVLPRHECQHD